MRSSTTEVPTMDLKTLRREVARDVSEATRGYPLGRTASDYIAAHAGERLPLWREAAEAGIAEAQWLLGGCYRDGNGVTADIDEALRWYRLAADQGEPKAQVNLGWCYESGNGVEKDPTAAAALYRQAAESGF